MVIVTGEIVLDEADVARIRDAALRMMDETTKEAGCLFYRFYQDIGRPGHIRVYEEWESEAHLDAHMKTPHMAEWRAAFEGIAVKSRRIQILRDAKPADL